MEVAEKLFQMPGATPERSYPSNGEWYESTLSSLRDKGKNMQKPLTFTSKNKEILFWIPHFLQII